MPTRVPTGRITRPSQASKAHKSTNVRSIVVRAGALGFILAVASASPVKADPDHSCTPEHDLETYCEGVMCLTGGGVRINGWICAYTLPEGYFMWNGPWSDDLSDEDYENSGCVDNFESP